MGIEVTYSAFFSGVHPDNFEDKLAEIAEDNRRIELEIAGLPVVQVEERVFVLCGLLEDYKNNIRLESWIQCAQESDDMTLSF